MRMHPIAEVLDKLTLLNCPSPEVYLEEDGDVCLDWAQGETTVSISISPIGRIGWAALTAEEGKGHGHFFLPDWSNELDTFLKLL